MAIIHYSNYAKSLLYYDIAPFSKKQPKQPDGVETRYSHATITEKNCRVLSYMNYLVPYILGDEEKGCSWWDDEYCAIETTEILLGLTLQSYRGDKRRRRTRIFS